MSVSPESAQSTENTYFLDTESVTEMARLMRQDQILTQHMGGIFPERPNLSSVRTILDIGCGSGGWVFDVAYAYPKKRVVGCDISQRMIEYARAQAMSQGLQNNTEFRVMDVVKALEFPDNSFDMVNARLIGGFLLTSGWPKLLQDCKRVMRPGGLIRMTTCEASFTTSPACSRLSSMFARALYRAGMSFSPDGNSIGMTPMMARLLRDAGYQSIGRMAHVIDYSAGEPAHESTYQNMLVAIKLMQPFLIKMGLTTQEEADQLYQQALIEMMLDDFCATWFYLTVWGSKL